MAALPSSAGVPSESITYGPWLGSMRSLSPDLVGPEWVCSIKNSGESSWWESTSHSGNFHYLPRSGTWKRRGGSTEKFDTFGSELGLLPAKWSSRIRHMEEFISDSVTDSVPTVCALLTRETVSTGTDDGRFSNFWWRDQVNGQNRTIGDEYATTGTYPAVGTIQYYRITPLWYDSGDGGITRGVSEFSRRFLVSGSRRFLKVGNWWYHPSVLGTPSRWNGVRASAGTTTLQANSDITITGTQLVIQGSTYNFAVSCTTNGTTLLTSAAAFGSVVANMQVSGSGITSGTYVVSKADSSNLTMSAAASNSTTASRTFAAVWGCWQTADSTNYTQAQDDQSRTFYCGLNGTVVDNTTYTITYRARYSGGTPSAGSTHRFALICSNQSRYTNSALTSTLTASFATYTMTITCNGTNGNSGLTASSLEFGVSGGTGTVYVEVDYVSITSGTSTAIASYLFPTGPFPPTHCGTVAGSGAVTPVNTRPDGTISIGGWTNQAGSTTNIWNTIDEATADDTDYIRSNASNSACSVTLATPASVPAGTDTVTIRMRVAMYVLSGHVGLTTAIGTTEGTAPEYSFPSLNSSSSFGFTASAVTLDSTMIAGITAQDADWSSVYIKFTTSSESTVAGVNENAYVSQAYLEVLSGAASAEGGWKGKDRFMRGFYYRFEDDSIWALTKPRFPNSTLANGLDLVTVDSTNPDLAYTSIVHSNIPIPPTGVKAVGICRTDKIDSTVDDNLLINPTGMKLIAEVPAGTTTYTDYSGDDASLTLDVEQYFIRYDHIMAPRARYIFGGDMRVCHAYGGSSPVAIEIAPVGRTADYDLNLADTSSTLYSSNASYMQVGIDSSGVGTLKLIQSDAATATDTKTITLTSTMTLQDLVDTINATSCTTDGQQWRAQVVPGAAPDAIALTSLTPHNRAIASCTIDNTAKTITAASGLSKVAVGQLVSGAAEETGAYVTVITSDTSLTYTGTLTTGTETLYFYNELGDAQITDPDTSALGFQRVIANSLPGFLYFNKTYLNTQTFDKAATWMTVATPGSVKASPNNWSGKLSNRFTPPLSSGFVQGGAAVDHGFVVCYTNKIGAIRPRGPDSFLDLDYGLVILDENRGCTAWNTITSGNRCVPYLTPEGMFAADLTSVKLISQEIYIDQPTAVGDFAYEGPQCVASAAADTDSTYAWARIMRGVLWVGYRTSASTTHVDRRVRLDFSTGEPAVGIAALFRRPDVTWGWSTPLTGYYGMMCEVSSSATRLGAGKHLLAWDARNSGSVGDGRIDEVETGTQDNGTDIAGRIEFPWLRPPDSQVVSGQEMIIEHESPSGSTGSIVYHRSFSDDSYTVTPGTSALGVYSEMKFLTQPARANANAVFVDYRQATGSSRELRRLTLKFKRFKRLRT